jgi:uncharacterized protein YjbJ (UPF0337 family)
MIFFFNCDQLARNGVPCSRVSPTESIKEIKVDKEHVKGFADTAKGTLKETAGKVSRDKGLETEGKFDKAKGDVHNAAGDAKDAVKKVIRP